MLVAHDLVVGRFIVDTESRFQNDGMGGVCHQRARWSAGTLLDTLLRTPLQYRTQIRLQEARRLMLADGPASTTIGLDVGYESPSQFNREYRKMFGMPPAADAARLRRVDGYSATSDAVG